MARCGRCGLWNKYPPDHEEKKFAGVCVWYQLRLPEDEVFEHRECKDFFEAIPGLSTIEHFGYKIKREEIGDAYTEAKRSKTMGIIALSVSIVSLLSGLLL